VAILALGFERLRSLAYDGIALPDALRFAAGGRNMLAVCYAILNELLGVVFVRILLDIFTEVEARGRRWRVGGFKAARYSHAAFLAHVIVLATMQYAIEGREGGTCYGRLGGWDCCLCRELGGWMDIDEGIGGCGAYRVCFVG